jgi:hypothetical protein
MNHFRIPKVLAVAGAIAFGTVFAQAQQSAPTPKPAPAATTTTSPPSTTEKVEAWTEKQWAAAQKEWSKNKTKWADCRKQSNHQKLSVRKSWSFLYTCMTS